MHIDIIRPSATTRAPTVQFCFWHKNVSIGRNITGVQLSTAFFLSFKLQNNNDFLLRYVVELIVGC